MGPDEKLEAGEADWRGRLRRWGSATPSGSMYGLVISMLVAGVGLGVAAVVVAGTRNASQPVESDVAAEEAVLEALEADPAQYVRAMGEMRAGDYTSESRRARFSKIETAYAKGSDFADSLEIERAEKSMDEDAVAAVVSKIRDKIGGAALDSEAVASYLRNGESVLAAAAGRAQNTERSRIIETGDDLQPHRREKTVVSLGRMIVAGLLGGVGSAVGALVAIETYSGPAVYAGAVALMIVGIGGIIVGAVDFDTFYLDTPVFWAWAGSSWLTTLVAAWIDGERGGLLVGIGGALGVAASFEVVARSWGKMRGITQGAGDTWIVLCTAGVPTAICGDWKVAIWSILAGAIGAAGHWAYIAVRRGADRNTPVPFGPWLVAGAWVAMAAWLVSV